MPANIQVTARLARNDVPPHRACGPRGALLAFACLLILAPSIMASSPVDLDFVRFHAPAQFEGASSTQAASGAWALLVFGERHEGVATSTVGAAKWTSFHDAGYGSHQPPITDGYGGSLPVAQITRDVETSRVDLAFARGASSLYVEAEALQLTSTGDGRLLARERGDCLVLNLGTARDLERAGRYDAFCPNPGPAALLEGKTSVALLATGVRTMEWHNAQATCPEGATTCPDGGARQERRAEAASGQLLARTTTHERLDFAGGDLEAYGTPTLVFTGATGLNLTVDGTVRLPISRADAGCAACEAPEGETLRLAGLVHLQDLRLTQSGLEAHVSGDINAARMDEQAVDPSTLGKPLALASVAVAASGLALAAKALWAFFSRIVPAHALRHPRRKSILDFVEANPGARIREAMRGTGLPNGPFRHHLAILESQGMLMRHRIGGRVLLARPGMSAADISILSLQRDPISRALLAWIRQNPLQKYGAIVNSAKGTWRQSRVEKRLTSLVRAGIVEKVGSPARYRIARAAITIRRDRNHPWLEQGASPSPV